MALDLTDPGAFATIPLTCPLGLVVQKCFLFISPLPVAAKTQSTLCDQGLARLLSRVLGVAKMSSGRAQLDLHRSEVRDEAGPYAVLPVLPPPSPWAGAGPLDRHSGAGRAPLTCGRPNMPVLLGCLWPLQEIKPLGIAVCHERKEGDGVEDRYKPIDAVSEMGEGPPGSPCTGRSQTTASCVAEEPGW